MIDPAGPVWGIIGGFVAFFARSAAQRWCPPYARHTLTVVTRSLDSASQRLPRILRNPLVREFAMVIAIELYQKMNSPEEATPPPPPPTETPP